MIRPVRFGSNPETAASNAFQRQFPDPGTSEAAIHEFDGLVRALSQAGAMPFVVADRPEPQCPDAVFPNNWVSFHEDGRVILYPMEAGNRRQERRMDVLEQIAAAGLIRLDRLVDLSALEREGRFLEGTGSLVMDRRRGCAYAALSSRTHPAAIAEFTRQTGMPVHAFHTADRRGMPLYHTNVMLSIGEQFAVICAEAIPDSPERKAVLRELTSTGRDVIEIDLSQMTAFAANILEVGSAGAAGIIAMSARAHAALLPDQRRRLMDCAGFAIAPVPVIERVGGGSVRCMIAEIFTAAAD